MAALPIKHKPTRPGYVNKNPTKASMQGQNLRKMKQYGAIMWR
jgi:hypothetical protein